MSKIAVELEVQFASPVPQRSRGPLLQVADVGRLAPLRKAIETESKSPDPSESARRDTSPCFITPSPKSANASESSARALPSGSRSALSCKGSEGVGEGHVPAGLSLCEISMDLLTLLDGAAMMALEGLMHDPVPVDEFIRCVSHAIGESAQRGESVSATLRDSEKNFQSLLRRALVFDDETLRFIARSIDVFNTGSIGFAAFMDFLVSAGRRVPPTEDAAASPTPSGGASQSSTSRRGSSLPAPLDAARLGQQPHHHRRFVAQEFDTVTQLAPECGYVQIIPLPQHRCFAAAALRFIDFIDETGATVTTLPRISMPSDPGATVACMCFAPELNEIFVGLNNSKVMSFGLDGRPARSALIVGAPSRISWDKPQLAAKEHDATGVIHCGTKDGTLFGLTTPAKGVLRVSFGTRLGSGDVVSVTCVPGTSLTVCACQKSVFVCCSLTGALKQRPLVHQGTVRAMSYHPRTGSVVYAHDAAPDSIFVLSKRTLRSVGNGAAEVTRASGLVRCPIVALAPDACNSHNVFSIDTNGNVHFWNMTLLEPVSRAHSPSPGSNGASAHVAVSVGVRNVASSEELRRSLLFGKGGLFALARKTAQVLVRGPASDEPSVDPSYADSEAPTDDMPPPVALLPCSLPHAVFFGGAEPSSAVVRVMPYEVELRNVADNAVVFAHTMSPSPGHSTTMGRSAAKRKVSSGCFGPGKLVLLLGTETGALLALSLEPSSMGELTVLEEHFGGCEIVNMHFFEKHGVIVAMTFDGFVVVGELKMGPRRRLTHRVFSDIGQAAAIACDDERNLLAVVDTHDSKLKLFYPCLSGNGLRAEAAVAIAGHVNPHGSDGCTLCFLPSYANQSGSGAIMAAFRKSDAAATMVCFEFSNCGTGKGMPLVHEAAHAELEGHAVPVVLCAETPASCSMGMSDGSVFAVERHSAFGAVGSMCITLQRGASESLEPIAAMVALPFSRNVVLCYGDKTEMLHLIGSPSASDGIVTARGNSPLASSVSPSSASAGGTGSSSPLSTAPMLVQTRGLNHSTSDAASRTALAPLPPIVLQMRQEAACAKALLPPSKMGPGRVQSAGVSRGDAAGRRGGHPQRCNSASAPVLLRRSSILEVVGGSSSKPRSTLPLLPSIRSNGKFAF